MKKVLVSCMAFVMLLSTSLTVLAAPGGFISSPSGNRSPRLMGFVVDSEDCDADLEITPYSERDELSDALETAIEAAYNEIVSTTDLSKLCAALAELAAKLNIPVSDLAVSDLFDVHYEGCTDSEHEGHGYFTIRLQAETLKNFVGLLHYNNGVWELIEEAEVDETGEILKFRVKDFSPFAIVVNTGASNEDGTGGSGNEGGSGADDGKDDGKDDLPQTGDNNNMVLYVGLMAVSGVALVVVLKKIKKQTV